ncbi:alpha-tocopherol transfer protein-like [Wyeomyia smithii]|uniref:alpha-tocopherol transfer protein-like n=1 Tax=Wyeomyia smithii TaxID=174621 RepID=UPI002468008D|nr:alpha-tocopherol transfer protein-like [Wyeomyia smithii]
METINYISVDRLYQQFPELRKQDVEELNLWVREQPHLPPVSELQLIQFLFSNYYDMAAAKRTTEAYFTFRTNCKDFFYNRDLTLEPLHRAMDILALCVIPKCTSDGYQVLFAKIIDPDVSKFSLAAVLKLAFICADIILWEEGCTEGHVLIIDMHGLHLGHLPKLGIFTLKNFLYYIQEALPIRLKGVHLINVVPFIDTIMMMIKPFLKKELLDIFHIHQKEETLYPFVAKQLLPKDYGGQASSRTDLKTQLYDKILGCREHLLQIDLSLMVDETKRLKTRSFTNMFGLF